METPTLRRGVHLLFFSFRSDYEGWKRKRRLRVAFVLLLCFRSDYEGWKPSLAAVTLTSKITVLEVTMRDGNTLFQFEVRPKNTCSFRSDYEGWKRIIYRFFTAKNFYHVLEVTMRDGNSLTFQN